MKFLAMYGKDFDKLNDAFGTDKYLGVKKRFIAKQVKEFNQMMADSRDRDGWERCVQDTRKIANLLDNSLDFITLSGDAESITVSIARKVDTPYFSMQATSAAEALDFVVTSLVETEPGGLVERHGGQSAVFAMRFPENFKWHEGGDSFRVALTKDKMCLISINNCIDEYMTEGEIADRLASVGERMAIRNLEVEKNETVLASYIDSLDAPDLQKHRIKSFLAEETKFNKHWIPTYEKIMILKDREGMFAKNIDDTFYIGGERSRGQQVSKIEHDFFVYLSSNA